MKPQEHRFRITHTIHETGLVRGDVVRYSVDEYGIPAVSIHRATYFSLEMLRGLVADGCAEEAPLGSPPRALSIVP